MLLLCAKCARRRNELINEFIIAGISETAIDLQERLFHTQQKMLLKKINKTRADLELQSKTRLRMHKKF
jgi:hypothetical protein